MSYKPTVLIVDDSEAFAMYFSLVLSRLGFNVVPTRDGSEALTLLKVIKPDIVIIDAAIKEKNGIKAPTLVSAVEHISNVPVLITYKEKDRKAFEECARHDHFSCVLKPVNILEFHSIIQECVTFSRNTKRRFLRTTFDKRVSITHRRIARNYYAVSLSEGGIFVRSVKPLPIGAKAEVLIKLKDGKPIRLKGIVIYKKDVYTDVFKVVSGMAIEFKDLTARHLKMLRDYILDLLVGDIIEEQKDIFRIDSAGIKKQSGHKTK
ncbi:MAG: response regulator [Thermodesulfovibrionales bacterium]|nr:response regulator [Thermodesulfovibrionales bacterium]MDP3112842.1 response regulator [Thermodesulfovibrionales bacterium]